MIAPEVKEMYNKIIGLTYDFKNNFIFLKEKNVNNIFYTFIHSMNRS